MGGSLWVVHEAGRVRLEGVVPPHVVTTLRERGAKWVNGTWECPVDEWERLEATLEACGIALGRDAPTTLRARTTMIDVTSMGEVQLRGEIPRHRPEWLGRLRVGQLVGVTPWALEEVIAACAEEGYEVDLTPAARGLLQLVQESRQRVRTAKGAEVLPDVPLANGRALWTHQREAVAVSRAVGSRLMLADEMGVGKSPAAIAIARDLGAQRVVVVCPSVAKYNWLEKVREFDGSEAVVLEGQSRKQDLDKKWVVLNYEILKHRLDELLAWEPDLVVFDESHYVKSPEADRTKAARKLSRVAPYVLPMTGTPIANRPDDLWSQLDLAQPGWWGRRYEFAIAFAGARKTRFGWRCEKATNTEALRRYTEAVILRRTRSEVLSYLPAKSRTIYPVALAPTHEKQYQEAWKRFVAWAKDRGSKAFENDEQVLSHINKLRQVSSEGRVGATVDYVRGIAKDEERPVVVIGYYLEHLHAIRDGLKASKLRVAYIDGSVPAARKMEIAKGFQAGDYDVLVGQIRAMGTAIDLFRSDTMVCHDPDWSPSDLQQVEDRLNRPGQTRPTQHIYMVGRDTYDAQVMKNVIGKMEDNSAVLDGNTTAVRDLVEGLRLLISEAEG